jgi:hypothetical protein
MHLYGIFQGGPRAGFVSFVALWLWSGATSAAQGPAPQAEPIEEIEITGRTSQLALRAEIVDIELRMFNLSTSSMMYPSAK